MIGCGGVGLAAIQGCRIAGASRIIAVDTMAWKLELAKSLGATDGVNAKDSDAVAAVQSLIPGGVDYAFECIGTKQTGAQVVAMVKKGGTAVMVGVVPIGQTVDDPGARRRAQRQEDPRLDDGRQPLPHRHAALRRLLPRRAS